ERSYLYLNKYLTNVCNIFSLFSPSIATICRRICDGSFIFINTAPPEIYTLSLHDALPISQDPLLVDDGQLLDAVLGEDPLRLLEDRKSTRLNSSHVSISYAVFCLKKKKETLENKASIFSDYSSSNE